MTRVVVALDSFNGALSAIAVARVFAADWNGFRPGAAVVADLVQFEQGIHLADLVEPECRCLRAYGALDRCSWAPLRRAADGHRS